MIQLLFSAINKNLKESYFYCRLHHSIFVQVHVRSWPTEYISWNFPLNMGLS